jgi:biotin carboxylase
MKEIWKQTGVPTAAFCVTRTLTEAERAVDKVGLPVILKPADSHGGATRGVIEVKAKTELPEALAYAQSFYADKRVIVEEVLEGSEHTVELIIYQGGIHIVAISDREKAPPYFRVDAAQIFPADIASDKIERICEVASMGVRAIGIDNSPVHVEVCYTAKGPKLIELGARCGGGGIPEPAIPYTTGVEMFKESIRIALGIPPVNLIPREPLRGSVVKYLILRPGRLKRVNGLENVKRMQSVLDLVFTKKPGDEINVARYGHDRCGHIVAGGGTRNEAILIANQAMNALTFEYEKDPE